LEVWFGPVNVQVASLGAAPRRVPGCGRERGIDGAARTSPPEHARGLARVVDVAGEAILFAVRDDGTGIDPERVARGMGLDIMQDRMEALSCTLEVESSPGLGTTVIGRVPTRVAESVGS
jgi:hypothetical protein